MNETFTIKRPNGSFMLYGHRGSETIDVQETGAAFLTLIYGGQGDEVVNIGKDNTLVGIQGPISVYGQNGYDKLNVNDQDSVSGTTYTLTAKTLNRLNAAQIGYYTVEALTLNMTGHDDVVRANQIPKNTTVACIDFGGADWLYGPPSAATRFDVLGPDVGVVGGSLPFSAIENLAGGDKKDRFTFIDGASLSGVIRGYGGSDMLDYAAVTYPVDVNLATTTATNVVGGVLSIEDVVGGYACDRLVGDTLKNQLWGGPNDDVLLGGGGNDSLEGGGGNDVLVGDAGTDRLFGDEGRDVLIGGADADDLFGGPDDDILIGGTTSHDQNVTALLAVLAEWSRTDLDYDQRILNLRSGGGLNGLIVLTASAPNPTVFDDQAKDSLRGGLGRDWFFAKISGQYQYRDRLFDSDLEPGERVDVL